MKNLLEKWKTKNREKKGGWQLIPVLLAAIVLCIPMQAQAATVKLNKSSVTLYVGQSMTLKVSGTKKRVAWSSTKKSVVSVSSKGKLRASKAGTATIRAKVTGKTLQCKVTVKTPDKARRDQLAKQEVKRIIKKYITADMNTAERAFVLSCYLSEHCAWQKNQSAAAYQKNLGNEAYAALVMKKAACSGFAKAYTLLCNAANVPVRHVNQSSWTHQWNEVKINGKWVKVDTYEGSFASTDGIRESILKKYSNSNGSKEKVVFTFTITQ